MLGCIISRIVDYDRAEEIDPNPLFPLPIWLWVKRIFFQVVCTDIWKFYSSVCNTEQRVVRGTEWIEKGNYLRAISKTWSDCEDYCLLGCYTMSFIDRHQSEKHGIAQYINVHEHALCDKNNSLIFNTSVMLPFFKFLMFLQNNNR